MVKSIGVSNYAVEDVEELLRHQDVSVTPAINLIELNPFLYRKNTLAYLDVTSLCQMAQVSKGFGRLADDGAVWREACGRCKEHQRARCLHQQMLEAEERERREQARRRRWRKWMRRLAGALYAASGAAVVLAILAAAVALRRRGGGGGDAALRLGRAAERRSSAVENIIASACGLGAKAEALRGAR